MTNKTSEVDQLVVLLIKYQTARENLTNTMARPTFSSSSHYSFDSPASSSAMSSSSELEETEPSSGQRTIRGIGPAQDSSRRRSMAIQDMLNPEENDSQSQSVLSSSSFGGRGRLTPTSEHIFSAMQYSPSPSQKPRQRVSPSKMRHDRRNRQSAERSGKSPSPTPSDVSARTTKYRAPYSTEEAHFIWFHKVDLKKKWPEIEIACKSFRSPFLLFCSEFKVSRGRVDSIGISPSSEGCCEHHY